MILSVRQASEKCNISSQAIFIAIKKNRLKAVKKNGTRWEIKQEDLKAYRDGLYSRRFLRHKGELVYPPDQGIMSLREAAKMLNLDENRLYYAVYKNRIKHERKGCAYILHVNDVIEFGKSFVGASSDG